MTRENGAYLLSPCLRCNRTARIPFKNQICKAYYEVKRRDVYVKPFKIALVLYTSLRGYDNLRRGLFSWYNVFSIGLFQKHGQESPI